MTRSLWLLCLTLIALVFSACQPIQPPSAIAPSAPPTLAYTDPIPPDPAVRIGQLENGLTYYIRHNTLPANRAEFWLAVNAGSLQEDEEQLGLAHLLEHMLFNGTRRFEGHELIDFLENSGMEFGPDVNAFTSFDETVYMLQVPTDDDELVQTAFDVLEDWAGYATLDPTEIDKERGVVVEEWRLSDESAWGRVQNEQWQSWLEGTRYAERLPIGDMEIVRNASPETIRRFYETWYRPDLMAVVAVGDFDVDVVEGLIQEHFSTLPAPTDPQLREAYPVPLTGASRYLVVTDPEFPYATVEVAYLREPVAYTTAGDFRTALIGRLFSIMLNQRFDELSRQSDAPFLAAVAYEGSFIRPVDIAGLWAQVQDDSITRGLAALITEAERAARYGFTESELERAKKDLIRQAEQAYDEREHTESNAHAFRYIDQFLSGGYLPSAELQLDLTQQLAPAITLAEVNERIAGFVGAENRMVMVTAPEKANLPVPTEADLAAVIEAAQAQTLEPYTDEVTDAQLMAETPAAVAIQSETTIEALGVTELLLANGVRVLVKPTDFKQDEVVFGATSPGGSSLLEAEELDEAGMISEVAGQSGVGAFDYTTLQKLLAGKEVMIYPWIGGLHEGIWGSASAKDLETLFQLLHLAFTQPRADEDAFATWQNQQRAWLANRELEPESALEDAYQEITCGEEPRCQPLTLDSLSAVDLARGFAIYQERFADADDFTFLFVGSFDLAQIKMLAQTYLGTLPTLPGAESWRDVSIPPPTGLYTRTLYKGEGERSVVRLIWEAPVDVAGPAERMAIDALNTILEIHLREQLREELGGTYGVWLMGNVWRHPTPASWFYIEFSCDPERAAELTAVVIDEIRKQQTEGPTAEDVAKFQAQAQRSHEEELEQNSAWQEWLEYYVETPEEAMTDILTFGERVAAVDGATVQTAAQHYLPLDNYIQLILYPEGYQQ
ncbi:MAG: insulinase family protein [Caldilineaceae bacterium]